MYIFLFLFFISNVMFACQERQIIIQPCTATNENVSKWPNYMPREIFHTIVSYLEFHELSPLRQTCKTFNDNLNITILPHEIIHRIPTKNLINQLAYCAEQIDTERKDLCPYFINFKTLFNIRKTEENLKNLRFFITEIKKTPAITTYTDICLNNEFWGNDTTLRKFFIYNILRYNEFYIASYAMYYNCTDLMKYLLENGMSPNICNCNREPFIFDAIQENKIEFIKLLILYNVDLNLAYNNFNPLLSACTKGRTEIVNLFLKYNLELTQENSLGYTPLNEAALWGHNDIMTLLIEHNVDPVDPNVPNQREGDTPLINACLRKNIDTVKLLLDYHANPNTRNYEGKTPLLYAVKNGNIEIVKLLLDYHANPNIRDHEGATPLLYAVKNGNIEIVKLLLKHHLNLNIVKTSLDNANQTNNAEIIKLLNEYITHVS